MATLDDARELLRQFIEWADKVTDGEDGVDYLNGDSKKYPTEEGQDAWDDLEKIANEAHALINKT